MWNYQALNRNRRSESVCTPYILNGQKQTQSSDESRHVYIECAAWWWRCRMCHSCRCDAERPQCIYAWIHSSAPLHGSNEFAPSIRFISNAEIAKRMSRRLCDRFVCVSDIKLRNEYWIFKMHPDCIALHCLDTGRRQVREQVSASDWVCASASRPHSMCMWWMWANISRLWGLHVNHLT